MTGQIRAVRCRNVAGRLLEVKLTERGELTLPGSALEQRLVAVNDLVLVYKFVSRAAGGRNPRLYDLLDSEIRAGTRLGQVFPDRYPPELARLMAYNVDVEEPFALLSGYTGEPAAGQVAGFDDAQRRQFQIRLLGALRLTAAAGVVHGAVSLDTVRWDGRQLQLTDFESAERAGEPRRVGTGSAVRSPEQVAGVGQADVRDDLWAAALLIRRLHLGAAMDGPGSDRAGDPELLRTLLDPIFDNPLERRPHAEDLLRRLRAEDHLPPLADPDGVLLEGRQLFELMCRGKRGPDSVEPPPAPPSGRRRRIFPLWASVALLVVLTRVAMLA